MAKNWGLTREEIGAAVLGVSCSFPAQVQEPGRVLIIVISVAKELL
jgi:hypothetical protein